ncbi:MAG: methylphosphotriester-DNA--protein-cysteine methyltransferase [Cognaticolwellia sp.]|jgi:methylphosphotriester-DNA--protein-cysteine methyltransferase
MMAFGGMPPQAVAGFGRALGTRVLLESPERLAETIAQAGFSTPLRFFQALLVHAHVARRL